MAKSKRKTARKTKLRRAAKKIARRSQAQPEGGKIHYLLRNIPKTTWKRFLAIKDDARFDLLTYISKEVEQAAPVAETPEPEPTPEPSPEPSPAPEAAPETPATEEQP